MISVDIYLLNNETRRTRCEIWSKFIKIAKRDAIDVVLMFLLLTFSCFYC